MLVCMVFRKLQETGTSRPLAAVLGKSFLELLPSLFEPKHLFGSTSNVGQFFYLVHRWKLLLDGL